MKVSDEDRELASRNIPWILSCSRRTDVPWAFLRQYLKGFEEGFMYIAAGARKGSDGVRGVDIVRPICVQPYSNHTRKGVVCISWWSKNYKKWIAAYQQPDSILHRYPVHLFNFTINSENLDLEPGMETDLADRLAQASYLANTFGAQALSCRFDPIVHYRLSSGGPVLDNLKDFELIMRHLGSLGVDHIVFSFCQAYPKSVRNMLAAGLELVTLNREQEYAILDRIMPIAHKYGVQMRCCGNKGLVGYPISTVNEEFALKTSRRDGSQTNVAVIGQSRCVDAHLAERIAHEKGYNITFSQSKDLRQRTQCECHRSTDIGQYTFQCPHGCIYCYANPMKRSKDRARNQVPQCMGDSSETQQVQAEPQVPYYTFPSPQPGSWNAVPPPQVQTMPSFGGYLASDALPPPLPGMQVTAADLLMQSYKVNYLMSFAIPNQGTESTAPNPMQVYSQPRQ